MTPLTLNAESLELLAYSSRQLVALRSPSMMAGTGAVGSATGE